MKYWRCWPIFQSVLPFGWLWPLVGHCIRFQVGTYYCDRCPWTEPIPSGAALVEDMARRISR